jgi:hypothetical protein
MDISGITWRGESIEDVEILRELPPALVRILGDFNGFILQDGAMHVRGACFSPGWHSVRAAWRGPNAFHSLYHAVRASDIPFAQDQVGDQFLIRDGVVVRLFAETGEVEWLSDSLEDFFSKVTKDIEGFLNVGLNHKLQPGQLLHAYPPFCVKDASRGVSLRPCSAEEVILVHAGFAKEIADIQDRGRIEIRPTQ